MYIPRRGWQAVTVAGQRVAPVGVGWPRALLIKATATQASVPWKCLQLRSQGAALPPSPVPVCRGWPPREDCRTQGGSRATGPGQAGSELWQQMEAGGQCHCCPDFFSFWKLKLVRLFSFLCF